MQESHHAILVIEESGRYLVYRDDRWGCLFFPNYRNENGLQDRLSADLGVPVVSLQYLGEAVHEKYAVPAGRVKRYRHTFYRAVLDLPPEMLKGFTRNGRQYLWKTFAELEADPDVQTRNMDVLRTVQSLE